MFVIYVSSIMAVSHLAIEHEHHRPRLRLVGKSLISDFDVLVSEIPRCSGVEEQPAHPRRANSRTAAERFSTEHTVRTTQGRAECVC